MGCYVVRGSKELEEGVASLDDVPFKWLCDGNGLLRKTLSPSEADLFEAGMLFAAKQCWPVTRVDVRGTVLYFHDFPERLEKRLKEIRVHLAKAETDLREAEAKKKDVGVIWESNVTYERVRRFSVPRDGLVAERMIGSN